MSRRDRAVAALLAALAGALVIAAVLGDHAGAAWPGRDGPVVYLGVRKGEPPYESGYRTTGLRVFEPGVPGSKIRMLTVDPSDADPAVSPEGRTIVFSREVPSGLPFPHPEMVGGLFVIGIDGSGLLQLTGGGPEAMRADGSRLGALTNRSRSGRRTFPRKLGYASPAYAPAGGSLVALARGGSGPHLVRIKLRDPRHPEPLPGGTLASAPVWAPG
jgi:hypothetical protein